MPRTPRPTPQDRLATFQEQLADRKEVLRNREAGLKKRGAALDDRAARLEEKAADLREREDEVTEAEELLAVTTVPGDGTYEVGVDIEGGLYQSSGKRSCHYTVYGDAEGKDTAAREDHRGLDVGVTPHRHLVRDPGLRGVDPAVAQSPGSGV